MNDSDFVVAFNILDSGYRQWWCPAFGLLLGMTFIFVASLIFNEETKLKKAILIGLIAAFTGLWVIVAFTGTFGDYWNCSHALASGKASYVEGTVDNFIPMPYYGHALESFTITGVPFSYSDYIPEAGFNQTSSHGGPIHQGLPVRIWYVGNEIVKLEIKR